LGAAAKMPSWWCMRPEAGLGDADLVLRQSLALHRRAGALHRDLKLAERLLAAEPNELNLARLLDIKTNLADFGDGEAAIDGFGNQSGRISSAI
jgi:DNA primase